MQRRPSNQLHTRLLSRLPAKERIRIRLHVLGGQLIRMPWIHKKLCAIAWPEADTLETGLEVHTRRCWMLSPIYLLYALSAYIHTKYQLPHRAQPAHPVPLLQT